MQEISMDVFRGITIMLLTIIAYMLIDSFLDIPLITIVLCAASGVLVIFCCKDINRSDLNVFRASMVMGIIFFIIGNYIVLTERENYFKYVDPLFVYLITMGFFFSAIGMIVMFSSIPIIVYKDLEEHFRRQKFT